MCFLEKRPGAQNTVNSYQSRAVERNKPGYGCAPLPSTLFQADLNQTDGPAGRLFTIWTPSPHSRAAPAPIAAYT